MVYSPRTNGLKVINCTGSVGGISLVPWNMIFLYTVFCIHDSSTIDIVHNLCDCIDSHPVSSTVATVATDQPSYSVTEFEDEQLTFNVELTGQKGPGRSCVVTVSTLDDSPDLLTFTPHI